MAMEIVLISGMSGSGKSVALHALEDAGYYCVDNLPPELLQSFVELKLNHQDEKVAIAMDARSAKTAIVSGDVTVSASVTVVFAIK